MCICIYFLIAHRERIITTALLLTQKQHVYSTSDFCSSFFVLDGHRMWTKVLMNVVHRQMISFLLLLLLFVSINRTNEINTTISNMTLEKNVMPIEKFLHQQLDNRQMSLNQTATTLRIRPWKKSNSIEMLKKMIANRQRSTNNSRSTTTTTTSTMSTSKSLFHSKALIIFLAFSAVTTRKRTTATTTTYSPPTSGPFVRMNPKLQPTFYSTEPPTTAVLYEETSADTRPIFTGTSSTNVFYSLTSTLRNNDSSNTTILAVILVCSFTGFLFVALILTFLLRYRPHVE